MEKSIIIKKFFRFLKEYNCYSKFFKNFKDNRCGYSFRFENNSPLLKEEFFRKTESINFLSCAFIWQISNEGYWYWDKFDDKWRDFINNEKQKRDFINYEK